MGKIQTAKADIEVYKLVTQKKRKAPFRNFQYEANKLYRLRKPLKLIPSFEGGRVIEEGFHAFTSKANAFMRNYGNKRCVVVKMTIPKGAKYCLGSNCEVAATSIRTGDLAALRCR